MACYPHHTVKETEVQEGSQGHTICKRLSQTRHTGPQTFLLLHFTFSKNCLFHLEANIGAKTVAIPVKSYKNHLLPKTELAIGCPETVERPVPAVLFLTGLERKLVMHKDSTLHHPEGRETRGREGEERREGGTEGRERGQ